ncbi:MAG: Lipopolysaccharide heptosyltransferase 1 [Candidatus Anoxychlamydiales bacterium]|nr:Lipopolysaccharide heptosyltransferase 1 [Candidatus Anoxychlamydiales bacterium]
MKVLIVKASSLGDIIQTLVAVDYLKNRKDVLGIDWAIDESYRDLINSLEIIDNAHIFNFKKLKRIYKLKNIIDFFKFIKKLRKNKYDVVFDLQGNIKSALVTFLSKAKDKVGFSKKHAREKLNVLSTNIHFDVKKDINIRLQYLSIVKRYFKDISAIKLSKSINLKLNEIEKNKVDSISNNKKLNSDLKIMICPGSRWENKMLSLNTLKHFLNLLNENLNVSFLFVWGSEIEKQISSNLNKIFINNSIIIDKINIPIWHGLMNKMDLVVAMDSASLHLSSIADVKSYGIFGPTLANVLKPIGSDHLAYQGICPYNYKFQQFCPILRSCNTGACIKQIKYRDLYNNLINFLKK